MVYVDKGTVNVNNVVTVCGNAAAAVISPAAIAESRQGRRMRKVPC